MILSCPIRMTHTHTHTHTYNQTTVNPQPMDLSPHGIASQGPLTVTWFSARLPAYAAIVLGYHSFWHITLCVIPEAFQEEFR